MLYTHNGTHTHTHILSMGTVQFNVNQNRVNLLCSWIIFRSCCTDLRSRVDGELQLRLLAVVHRQTLHQQRGEAGAGAATKGMEDEETLKTRALVSQLPDAVQNQIHYFFANGVMAAGVVVCSILFAGDQLLWVKQLPVCACSHLIWKHSNLIFSNTFMLWYQFDSFKHLPNENTIRSALSSRQHSHSQFLMGSPFPKPAETEPVFHLLPKRNT